ncbi:Fungal transcriptional regulatory [Cordyceps militaris]|uniref:Fungal transcriptional regulatory n=1 Tax=Cordyceps militaris TaxID=73501 RepID=A0A2H4S6U4_CORMI|nr:Fungal transcriptional regulatory [Cordyceps militaris]
MLDVLRCPGHDAASPGGYAPTVTHPSPPRNATEEWSDGSGVVGARVSEAPAPSRTEVRRRPATRSHPWPPSAHEQGSDTAREYILSPSSLQSAPQTLGASPHLDWLGPAVPGDWMPSAALDAGGASQSFFNVDDATAAWASLLIHDASSRIEAGPGLGALGPLPPRDCEQRQEDAPVAQRPSVQEAALSTLDSGLAYEQDKPWQSSVPLKLEKHEYLLFQDFVQNLSLWMRNVGLMNAILALSIRHLSLNVRFQPKDSVPQDPLDALPFYFLTLRYIRSAMQHDSYRSSLELLATASIVSAYEMLDGSRPDWERHLRGLSCIQHAQRIHGASGGLRQAVWWTWLCQDVWAAWRERRKPLTTWRPHTPPPELDSFALAARAVYLFGQAVGFCAQDEVARGRRDPEARLASAQSLRLALDRWRKSLPPDFDPLPLDSADEDSVFEPIWIHPPNFGE